MAASICSVYGAEEESVKCSEGYNHACCGKVCCSDVAVLLALLAVGTLMTTTNSYITSEPKIEEVQNLRSWVTEIMDTVRALQLTLNPRTNILTSNIFLRHQLSAIKGTSESAKISKLQDDSKALDQLIKSNEAALPEADRTVLMALPKNG